MVKSAVVSECEKYRYQLVRVWDETLPRLVFVMLNPSTADATADDPTIRKDIGFAKANGFGGIEIYNLFAWRATNPKELLALGEIVRIGPENRRWLSNIDPFATVVAAWGMNPYKHIAMFRQVEWVLKLLGPDLKCVKKSGDKPWHPLYVSYGPLLKLEN